MLRVSSGDVISITLVNRLNFSINIEPTGLTILPSTSTNEKNADNILVPEAEPNATITYRWLVPNEAAPTSSEADTKLYLYRSTVYPEKSDNAGLYGAILVSRPGADLSSGRDVITVAQIIDENASPYLDANLNGRDAAALGMTDELLDESLLKHAINGYLFCNVPKLEMTQGENIRWHFAAVGSEGDMHTAHIHGNTWLEQGHRADQILLIPGSAHSVVMDARAPGQWLLHCHVNDHIHAGMMAIYTVLSANNSSATSTTTNSDTTTTTSKADVAATAINVPANSTVRRYYIAAELVQWNYAPLGGDACPGASQTSSSNSSTTTSASSLSSRPVVPWSEQALEFLGNGTGKAGGRYTKAQYIEYTDATFTKKKVRSATDAYLGILGPIMRAEVGDTIEVIFRNTLNNSVSVHPHGVAYNKSSEGSPYNDGTTGSDRADDAVPPDSTYTYVWAVPETAGPGLNDPSTIAFMVHSHTSEVQDPYAGLIAAIIVGRPGAFRRDANGALGTAVDVDRDAVVLFGIMNERQSFLWKINEENIAQKDLAAAASSPANEAPAPASTVATAGRRLMAQAPAPTSEGQQSSDAGSMSMTMPMGSVDGEMVESDMMHAINGYLYCNAPPLVVTSGSSLRLHVIAIGTEVDLHSPSLTGATLESEGQRGPALAVMPGVMTTADIKIEASPGPAVLQCRVADHIAAGMQALVSVQPDVTVNKTDVEAAAAAGAVVRPYFISAEETLWDYTPLSKDNCANSGPRAFTSEQSVFTTKHGNTIGSQYTKAVYRRYNDSTYTQRIPVPAHQGILGPIMAGEVGDVLEITFKNSLDIDVNLRLDGGFVPLEGSYDPLAKVGPGQVVKYKLSIPER